MKNTLLEGPVGPALARMALPIFVGMGCTVSFQLADTYFVSSLGPETLTAIGLIFPVTLTLMHLATGLDIGTMSTVSRLLGAGDRPAARKLIMDTLWLTALMSGALGTVGLLTMDPVFTALGAEADTLPHVKRYMVVWYSGLVLTNLPTVFAASMRANGNAAIPGALQSAAALLNVVLDPLLIFGAAFIPSMGIQGAAIASLIARGSYALALGAMLARREGLLTLSGYRPAGMLQSWRTNLAVSIPASAGNILSAATGLLTVKLIAGHGAAQVGGVAVGTRLEALALITTLSLAIAMAPFIGQNLGARNFERIAQGLRFSYRVSAGLGVALWLLLAAVGPHVVPAFSDDPAVQATTMQYLYWVGAALSAGGVLAVGIIALNALGSPMTATALIAARVFLVYAPAAWALDHAMGVQGVFLAVSGSQFLFAGITTWVVHEKVKSLQPSAADPTEGPLAPATVTAN